MALKLCGKPSFSSTCTRQAGHDGPCDPIYIAPKSGEFGVKNVDGQVITGWPNGMGRW